MRLLCQCKRETSVLLIQSELSAVSTGEQADAEDATRNRFEDTARTDLLQSAALWAKHFTQILFIKPLPSGPRKLYTQRGGAQI